MANVNEPGDGEPAVLRQRYGDTNRRPTGKLIIIGVAILLVVCVAYVMVQMSRVSDPDVTGSPAGWSRQEGREDDIFIFTLDVTRKDPAQDSYCVIYAMDYDLNEVGRRDVLVPGGGEPTVRIDVPIETRDQAVAGKVYGCSTDIPDTLRRE
ncbi:DUF4307 domain-containing protein [Corynebacterium sp.]|uniref:DUF4307 domain-containing protein n=1 Tax=Corynebacterium sp. TaxID=1720 RepID=UPI0026DB8E3E|nr:DUF4307 domain-containing protein [Corynebacterium sp.]MDO4610677.1 DUF4307 domain-containing protein [Corynebacterium sp.]